VRQITLAEAIEVINLADEYLKFDEPIGPINEKAMADLSSAISQPFASFDGKYQYHFLYQRAAALFYYVIKDHCLHNGNKRSAVLIMMVFLLLNGKDIQVSPKRLYELACSVAESHRDNKDEVIRIVAKAIKYTMTDYVPSTKLK
jgi:death-on-curing protein